MFMQTSSVGVAELASIKYKHSKWIKFLLRVETLRGLHDTSSHGFEVQIDTSSHGGGVVALGVLAERGRII